MFLRVGEVVMERNGNLIGVVVSWDPEMRAPQEWVDRVYASSEVSIHNSTHTHKSSPLHLLKARIGKLNISHFSDF